jgi:hypothetical protein
MYNSRERDQAVCVLCVCMCVCVCVFRVVCVCEGGGRRGEGSDSPLCAMNENVFNNVVKRLVA